MPKFLINTAAALGVVLALGGVAAEAGPAGKVVVMESASAITPGASWAWAPFTTTSPDPRVANDIMQERMHVAVEAAMANHGLRRASRADARYLVSYHIAVANKVDAKVRNNGYQTGVACGFRGCVRGYAYAAPTVDIKPYAEGTLVIDIVERDTGRLVWRAASKKKVTEKDATQANLNAVVADMTKTLPRA